MTPTRTKRKVSDDDNDGKVQIYSSEKKRKKKKSTKRKRSDDNDDDLSVDLLLSTTCRNDVISPATQTLNHLAEMDAKFGGNLHFDFSQLSQLSCDDDTVDNGLGNNENRGNDSKGEKRDCNDEGDNDEGNLDLERALDSNEEEHLRSQEFSQSPTKEQAKVETKIDKLY